jgi:hypothetical protein
VCKKLYPYQLDQNNHPDYGRVLLPLPLFHLGTTALSIKIDEKYVGINLTTDTQNTFTKLKHAPHKIHRERVLFACTGFEL